MKLPTLSQLVLFICALAKKIDCVQDCGSRRYYSEDVHGCVWCPLKCSDQNSRDIDRCKKACETTTTATPELPLKSDKPTLIHVISPPNVRSTEEPFEAGKSLEKTAVSDASPKPKHSETASSTHVGLAVGLSVSGTIVVFLFAYIVWRECHSKTSPEVDVEAQVETGGEPSTSSLDSRESSPVAKKHSQRCQASSMENINGIQLPLPETQKLITCETNGDGQSSLCLNEHEN